MNIHQSIMIIVGNYRICSQSRTKFQGEDSDRILMGQTSKGGGRLRACNLSLPRGNETLDCITTLGSAEEQSVVTHPHKIDQPGLMSQG